MIFVFVRSFLEKTESKISILNILDKEAPMLDLEASKQLIYYPHFIFGTEPTKLFTPKAYYVTENLKTKSVEKTPLDLVPCDSIDFAAKGINFVKNPLITYYDCIDMKTGLTIGESSKNQTKRYISLEVYPCLETCYIHNFATPPLLLGPQEIKPSNFNPYFFYVNRFFAVYIHLFGYINSVLDLTNFSAPISKAMGLPVDMQHNLNIEVQRKMIF